MGNSLYEQDYHAWTMQQAELLRSRQLDCADLDNIAEEIESMGRSLKRELTSRLTVLLMRLLKWQHQPGFRGRSWRLTIRGQRLSLRQHLRDNPSLKSTSIRPYWTRTDEPRSRQNAKPALPPRRFPGLVRSPSTRP